MRARQLIIVPFSLPGGCHSHRPPHSHTKQCVYSYLPAAEEEEMEGGGAFPVLYQTRAQGRTAIVLLFSSGGRRLLVLAQSLLRCLQMNYASAMDAKATAACPIGQRELSGRVRVTRGQKSGGDAMPARE